VSATEYSTAGARSCKLLNALDETTDIAIGSRWLRAETQTQRQPVHRQIFGRIFNLLLRLTLGLHFKDTQCGFKAFKRPAALAIFPLQKIERWGFDPEILFLARKLGFKVKEVPVLWGHSGGTRINPLVDGFRMFTEMLRVRWYSLTGRYDGSAPQLLTNQNLVAAKWRKRKTCTNTGQNL
jgi:dolichyl-phosphate beta-glucosyltransferase